MKVLYAVPYRPFPVNSGPKNVSGNLIRYLAKHSELDIALVGVDADAGSIQDEVPQIMSVRAFPGLKGFRLSGYKIRTLAFGCHPILAKSMNSDFARFLSVSAELYDLVIFDYFWLSHFVRKLSLPVVQKTVLLGHDAYSLYYQRAAAHAKSPFTRLRLNTVRWLLSNIEKHLYARFATVITVSSVDATFLRENAKCNVAVIDVPLGDEYYSGIIKPIDFHSPFSILVVPGGSKEWIYKDSIHLLERLLPAMAERHVETRIVVWMPEVTQSQRRDLEGRGVEVVAYVSDYLEFLNGNWIYAYPKTCSAGMQTKIPQAMACGLPVVAHENTLRVFNGSDGIHYFSCSSVDHFVDPIMRLLVSADLREAVGRAAREFSLRVFSKDIVCSEFLNICRNATGA